MSIFGVLQLEGAQVVGEWVTHITTEICYDLTNSNSLLVNQKKQVLPTVQKNQNTPTQKQYNDTNVKRREVTGEYWLLT